MALRVLLADESPSIKKVFNLSLQDFGVEVKSVNAGIDALQVAQSFAPDIVFADILLPKRNGYDVCSDIKQDNQTHSIPVVLMWSSFMDLDKDKFDMAKADASLEKPFEVETLRQIVNKLVPRTQENPLAGFVKMPDSLSRISQSDDGQPAPPQQQAPLDSEQTITSSSIPAPPSPQIPDSPPPPAEAHDAKWNMDSFEDIKTYSGDEKQLTNQESFFPVHNNEQDYVGGADEEVHMDDQYDSNTSTPARQPSVGQQIDLGDTDAFRSDSGPTSLEDAAEELKTIVPEDLDIDSPDMVVHQRLTQSHGEPTTNIIDSQTVRNIEADQFFGPSDEGEEEVQMQVETIPQPQPQVEPPSQELPQAQPQQQVVKPPAEVATEEGLALPDSDDQWSHQNLNEFKVDIPPGPNLSELDTNDFPVSMRKETTQTELDEPEEILLGDGDAMEPPVQAGTPTPTSTSTMTENSSAQVVADSHQPNQAPNQVSQEKLEEIIRAQVQETVEAVVWKVVPELAKTVIEKELNRLLQEAEKDETGNQ